MVTIIISNRYTSNQMQEQHRRRSSKNPEITLRIRMEPKSLEMSVPIQWDIGKVKCMLCTIIPRLEFGMIKFEKNGVEIPSNKTIREVFAVEISDESERLFVLDYKRVENRQGEFDKYYASKWIPLFSSMKHSPFQPLLHPNYYAMHTQLVQTQELTSQNLRVNLQNLMNVRNLLNLNNPQNNNNNAPANEQPVNADGGGGLLGRPNAGGNVFQRGMYWVFKAFQLLIMWQLLSFVMNHISTAHICIMVAIVVFYLVIDHFQKKKKNRPREEEQGQRQEQRQGEERRQQREEGENGEENKNQQESENKQEQDEENDNEEMDVPDLSPQIIKIIGFLCLFGQTVISFVMSLFPNWTVQLHLNMLAPLFNKIDPIFDDQQPQEHQQQQGQQEEKQENDGEDEQEQRCQENQRREFTQEELAQQA